MSWKELNSRAYVPYSRKGVSCVIEGSEGGLYAGVRIENVSYPLTISALQAACCICLSEGEKPEKLITQSDKLSQLQYWKSEFDLKVQITDSPPLKLLSSLYRKKQTNEKEKLKKLLFKAITIHSNFPVSALLYTEGGCYEGVNIEVSDWSMGLCAERIALAKALADANTSFTELTVHTRHGEVSSPCGACRQVIIEHMPLNKIRLFHSDNTLTEHFSTDLLPFSFTSKSLKK